MRIITIAVPALLGIALFLGALPWGWDYLNNQRANADNTFKAGLDDEYLGEQAALEISERGNNLKTKYVTVFKLEHQVSQLQNECKHIQNSLEKNRAVLTKAQEWLKSHGEGDALPYGGKTLSYSDVLSKSRELIDESQRLESSLAQNTSSAAKLQAQLKKADSAFNTAFEQLRKEKGEVEANRLKLAVLRLVQESQQVVEQFTVASGTKNRRYGNALAERTMQVEAETTAAERMSLSGSVRDELPFGQVSDLQAIDSYLASGSSEAAISIEMEDLGAALDANS